MAVLTPGPWRNDAQTANWNVASLFSNNIHLSSQGYASILTAANARMEQAWAGAGTIEPRLTDNTNQLYMYWPGNLTNSAQWNQSWTTLQRPATQPSYTPRYSDLPATEWRSWGDFVNPNVWDVEWADEPEILGYQLSGSIIWYGPTTGELSPRFSQEPLRVHLKLLSSAASASAYDPGFMTGAEVAALPTLATIDLGVPISGSKTQSFVLDLPPLEIPASGVYSLSVGLVDAWTQDQSLPQYPPPATNMGKSDYVVYAFRTLQVRSILRYPYRLLYAPEPTPPNLARTASTETVPHRTFSRDVISLRSDDIAQAAIEEPQMKRGLRGSPDKETATEMTVLSVSDPTPSYLMHEEDEYTGEKHEAWWKFTADRDGQIYIDTLLSSTLDGRQSYLHPNLQLEVLTWETYPDRPEWDGWNWWWWENFYQPNSQSEIDRGFREGERPASIMDVEKGKTYYIGIATEWDYYSHSNYVLRISDYGVVEDWVQPPDQEIVIQRTDYPGYNVQNTYDGSKPGNERYQQYYLLDQFSSWSTGFHGSWQLSRAFGGIAPGADWEAHLCSWSLARKANRGGFFDWWSLYGGGSWNGTDPYNPSVPGHGTCRILTGVMTNATQGYSDHPVGYAIETDVTAVWYYYQDLTFRAFAMNQTVNLHSMIEYLTRDGGNREYLPPLGDTMSVEFENQHCELVKLWVAPDEPAGGGSVAHPETAVSWFASPSLWYTAELATPGFPLDAETWGPRNGSPGWVSASGGPEQYMSHPDSEFLADYAGGTADWIEIDWEKYWDLESELGHHAWATTSQGWPKDSDGNPIPDDELYYPSYFNNSGLNLVALPRKITDLTPPSELGPFMEELDAGSKYRFRSQVFCGFKVRTKPTRYRISHTPEIPDFDLPKPKPNLTGSIEGQRRRFDEGVPRT
jgi:hypothetical protein